PPVDVLNVHRSEPSNTSIRIWRLRSTSTTTPSRLRGAGRVFASSAASVRGPAMPSRGRFAAFCRAMTAWLVASPYTPSGVATRCPRRCSRCWSCSTAAPRSPSRNWSTRTGADDVGEGPADGAGDGCGDADRSGDGDDSGDAGADGAGDGAGDGPPP